MAVKGKKEVLPTPNCTRHKRIQLTLRSSRMQPCPQTLFSTHTKRRHWRMRPYSLQIAMHKSCLRKKNFFVSSSPLFPAFQACGRPCQHRRLYASLAGQSQRGRRSTHRNKGHLQKHGGVAGQFPPYSLATELPKKNTRSPQKKH